LSVTEVHFAREDRLMKEYRFPPYAIHNSEHKHTLEAMRAAQANWLATRDYRVLENYIKQDWHA